MRLHHHFNAEDDEVVLLYPPVIGRPSESSVTLGDLPRLDVHGRPRRQPEPLELVDRDDLRIRSGDRVGRWGRPVSGAADGIPRA
jgi:hypothetical protein